MAKNIVVLSDGTGNSSAKIWRTNVWRLYEALDLTPASGQLALYDDGVGSSSFKPLAILGGAVGFGLKRNVLDLYVFLCRNYEPNDRIYGFGFSRGAYTIRELVAFVMCKGLVRGAKKGEPIPDGELRRMAKLAYLEYRAETDKKGARILVHAANAGRGVAAATANVAEKISERLHGEQDDEEFEKPYEPRIHFLGLWDTVAAYGLPIEEMKRGVDLYFLPLSFPDRKLNDRIDNARHAVSLDDERLTFHPVLWTEEGENKAKNIDKERISQVWFAGVHSNVGGGYPDDSLAHVPLKWIMDEAERCQLKFKPDARKSLLAEANPRGRLYDSRHGLSAYYRYMPRKMALLTQDKLDKSDTVVIDVPKVHESVFERIKRSKAAYTPIVLPAIYAVVTDKGEIKAGIANPYEHPTQARSRANAQERVWNLVWGRRVTYFLTLFSSGFLAGFPIFFEAWPDGVCSGNLCFVSRAIGAVGAFVPGALSPWIESFKSYPGWFLIGAGLVGGFLYWGTVLQRRITDRMEQLWAHVLKKPHKVKPEKLPSDWIFRLRNWKPYQATFRALRRWILPTAFALAIVALVPVVLDRLGVALFSSGLWNRTFGTEPVCKVTLDSELKDVPAAGIALSGSSGFRTDLPCWPSGYRLFRGTTYRITIEMDANWGDAFFETSLLGYSSRDIYRSGDRWAWPKAVVSAYGTLYRRWLTANWMQPIARIGANSTDEFRLDPTYTLAQTEHWKKLVSDVTARSQGELYLYVNGTELAVPGKGAFWFYQFHHGSAKVTIQPQ